MKTQITIANVLQEMINHKARQRIMDELGELYHLPEILEFVTIDDLIKSGKNDCSVQNFFYNGLISVEIIVERAMPYYVKKETEVFFNKVNQLEKV